MKMLLKAYNIEFTGVYQGQEYYLQTYDYEYRNLMALLKDKIYPDDFGQCGGMGRCGTCLVTVSGTPQIDWSLPGNEPATISQMQAGCQSAKLACQVQIDEDLKNTIVEIFDSV